MKTKFAAAALAMLVSVAPSTFADHNNGGQGVLTLGTSVSIVATLVCDTFQKADFLMRVHKEDGFEAVLALMPRTGCKATAVGLVKLKRVVLTERVDFPGHENVRVDVVEVEQEGRVYYLFLTGFDFVAQEV